MDLSRCNLEFFQDFLAETPEVEAIEHIDARLQRVTEDRKATKDWQRASKVFEVLNIEEDTLRVLRAQAVARDSHRKWSRGVRALFGEEGLQSVLEWLKLQPGGEIQDIARSRARAIRNHSR